MSGWLAFWNRPHRIYVNARHMDVHYRRVARDIMSVLPGPGASVLDFGCGEALHADDVAARVRLLWLCEAAPSVRERVAARFAEVSNIRVIGGDGLAPVPDAGLDLVVVSSVTQYLSGAELDGLLAEWRRKLRPGGTLVLADVLPPEDSLVADVTALVSVAAREGFFLAALGGLAATFFSDYRKLRRREGLTRYAAAAMLAKLCAAGFTAERRPANLGFNQARMTFVARRLG